jgi:hypothetical protein
MREIRLSGSEGGGVAQPALPTPISCRSFGANSSTNMRLEALASRLTAGIVKTCSDDVRVGRLSCIVDGAHAVGQACPFGGM